MNARFEPPRGPYQPPAPTTRARDHVAYLVGMAALTVFCLAAWIAAAWIFAAAYHSLSG